MESSAALGFPRVFGPASRRLLGDTHVLLGIAVALSATTIEAADSLRSAAPVAIAGFGYVAVQVALAAQPSRLSRSTPRLLVALAFVFGLGLVVGPGRALPLASLYLPIVTMAAVYGGRKAIIVGVAALAMLITPAVFGFESIVVVQARTPAFVATMLLLTIGTRRTVGALEATVRRARSSMSRERRGARQMAGVEAVGRILASDPSGDSLDQVMDLLVRRFGYTWVSIYLKADDGALILGAQRGYHRVVGRFDGTTGVVGRVMRTGEVQLVRDVSLDPDYHNANDDVRSEISAPLFAGGDLIGVLNVEDSRVGGLDDTDRSTLVLIAERLAGAIALGRDRQALTERAARFAALAAFAQRINASLDPREVYPLICEAVSAVIPSDVVVVTVLDVSTGEYRIAAMSGPDQRSVGVRIIEGEGMAGAAIAEHRLVVDDHFDQECFPSTLRSIAGDAAVASLAVPLLRDGDVLGALTLVRRDLSMPNSALDREVAPIVAGLVALAIANAALHAQAADAAIRDALTGLANRRHLDASLERLGAARERLDPDDRRPLSAILFDLDHFGAFNKRHGHATGDAVLRTFGSILAGRFRAGDIVARYGGEEFLVVLDGATLDEARRAAEDVRAAFAAAAIDSPSGPLKATVSAGCSTLGPSAASIAVLLGVADVALQMAKRGGRDQVVAA
ncbi:MAG: diguanylate cyclase [Chloroflexota bacterium]